MSAFKGYLLRATKTNTRFPAKYIEEGTWSSTPNQREEIKAYRDDNTRDLYRVTAKGKKSIFSFSTRPNLHLADKIVIQNFFYENESNVEERKINLEYWDDDNNTYKTGDFYRPNMPFKIIQYSNDDIIYDSFDFDFVEY
jgi:hypothetical protein